MVNISCSQQSFFLDKTKTMRTRIGLKNNLNMFGSGLLSSFIAITHFRFVVFFYCDYTQINESYALVSKDCI